MALPLLQTKLFIPPSHNLLPRPGLMRELEESRNSHHPLVLVSSSAGSGKTSLISAWASHHPEEFAWLSLDVEDNEPQRFWRYVLAAVQRVRPGFGQDAIELLASPQLVPSQTILIAFLNELANLPNPVILVLDDYHVISNAEIHTGMVYLIEHLPPQVCLVVSTRADPPLPVNRLRAHNRLIEIREANLQFFQEEASQFFQTMGVRISDEDVQALVERTEGWIAGLQLAGLALKASTLTGGQRDPHQFIAALRSSHLYILEYLADEVFSRLEAPVQDFLVKTSILERMCAGLCAEVIQDPGSNQSDSLSVLNSARSILKTLERSNLFTFPLDPEHTWFRYHHLFSDLLSSRLRAILPVEEIQKLHCRAGNWLAHNGQVDEGLSHVLLGKDFDLAASMVETQARSMMFSGRVNALRSWIEALPEASLQTHPRLKIYAVWIDLLQGICELSKQKVQETEQLVSELPSSPENDRLKVELMVVLCRFIAISGNTAQAIRIAHEALVTLPKDDLASRARVESALSIAYGLEGEIEKSETSYRECIHLAQAAGYYSLGAHTTLLVAMGQAHYGKLHGPARDLQAIVDLGMQSGQKHTFPVGQGYVGLASVYLEWNDLDRAGQLLEQGIDLCRQGGIDGVFAGLILKSRLRQAKGDLKGALEEIQAVEQGFQRKDHDTTARQVKILLAMGDIEAASGWITPLTAMLAADPVRLKLPTLFLEVFKITLARILVARREFEPALRLLDEIQAEAGAGKRAGHLLEVYLLKAIAIQAQHGKEIVSPALENFRLALDLAEPEGYTLLFLEAGAGIFPFLNATIHRPTGEERLQQYAARILDSFPVRLKVGAAPYGEETDLTRREIEVLRLIGEGLSNQEIAERLVVALDTVKKHSTHIFAKLGATSRTQAVARARQAGLL